MNELRKKIITDLFISPMTIVPATIGGSLMLLSLVAGFIYGFVGFCFLLISFGIGINNCLFNYDKTSKQTIEKIEKEKQIERNNKLDELDVKLSSDRDPRDQKFLRDLRAIYDTFIEDIKAGKITIAAGLSIRNQIDEVFNQCVQQLEFQYELLVRSRKFNGKLKDDLLKQRNNVLDEIEKSVFNLTDVISEVGNLGVKAKSNQLSLLKDRLNIQLNAAKEAEKIITDATGDSLNRFSEYQ